MHHNQHLYQYIYIQRAYLEVNECKKASDTSHAPHGSLYHHEEEEKGVTLLRAHIIQYSSMCHVNMDFISIVLYLFGLFGAIVGTGRWKSILKTVTK
jgi:hypothetical protein